MTVHLAPCLWEAIEKAPPPTMVDKAPPPTEIVPFKIPTGIIDLVMANRYAGDGTGHPVTHLLYLAEL